MQIDTKKHRDRVADELFSEYDIETPRRTNGLYGERVVDIQFVAVSEGESKKAIEHAKGMGFSVEAVHPETGVVTLTIGV